MGTTHYKKSNIEFDKTVTIKSGGTLNIEATAAFQIGGVTVSSDAAELNMLDGSGISNADLVKIAAVTAAATELNAAADGTPLSASIATPTAVTSYMRMAKVTLTDGAGVALAVKGVADAYLSKAAAGASPTTGAQILDTTGSGATIQLEQYKMYRVISTTAGIVDVSITTTGATSVYLNLILPTGKLISSTAAITFAAT